MARPPTPSAILQLRGSFKTHPERVREDAPGAGAFDESPPECLTGAEIAAWREMVAALPRVALTGSERPGVTQMARLWATLKATHPASPDFKKLDDSFRQWCVQMGMTVVARVKLGSHENQKQQNEFSNFKGD